MRHVVVLTRRDGHSAVLALGEVASDFEAKQPVLAERTDSKPLGPEHLRAVVPGDGKAGRSVRDIAVLPLPPTH